MPTVAFRVVEPPSDSSAVVESSSREVTSGAVQVIWQLWERSSAFAVTVQLPAPTQVTLAVSAPVDSTVATDVSLELHWTVPA